MINRRALIIVLAAAASSNAFVVPSHSTIQRHSTIRPLFSSVNHEATSSVSSSVSSSASEQLEKAYQQAVEAADTALDAAKMIMDIPPSPVAPKTAAAPKKKGGNPHKEGLFSPIVVAAGAVLGDEQLNKIRGKVISLHSDLIKSFVDTADSAFGNVVLRQLFDVVDVDKSGYLDKTEVATALNMLGFKWLGEKQVDGIFARADANGDSEISLEEFMVEAPRTLRTNLVKLAKSNGAEMGLLV